MAREACAAALREAPSGPIALAGHSLGGYVAFEIMRQAPERVSRLALLNTNARPDSPESTENRRRLMALAETDLRAVIDEGHPLPAPVPMNYVSDLTLVTHELGWRPEVTVDEGLRSIF